MCLGRGAQAGGTDGSSVSVSVAHTSCDTRLWSSLSVLATPLPAPSQGRRFHPAFSFLFLSSHPGLCGGLFLSGGWGLLLVFSRSSVRTVAYVCVLDVFVGEYAFHLYTPPSWLEPWVTTIRWGMVTQRVNVESKTFIPEINRANEKWRTLFFFFLVTLGFHCCVQAFSSCSECWPVFLTALQWLLLWNTGSSTRASGVVVHRLHLLHGFWKLLGPGIQGSSWCPLHWQADSYSLYL